MTIEDDKRRVIVRGGGMHGALAAMMIGQLGLAKASPEEIAESDRLIEERRQSNLEEKTRVVEAAAENAAVSTRQVRRARARAAAKAARAEETSWASGTKRRK